MTDTTRSVEVRRSFAASRDRVFEAFRCQDSLARWF